MTALGLTPDVAVATDPHRAEMFREVVGDLSVCPANSQRGDQIQGLVHQLFFRQAPGLVRHVGFAAVEPQVDAAQLCLDVATALAGNGPHDVGLIDARLHSEPLQTQLQIPPGNRPDASWLIAPRLWLAPRRKWLDDRATRIWDPSLTRLRSVTLEFDFSILCLDRFSWLTARLSQACNGVVLVLTANKTRRVVATRMLEQLRHARIPVLGTVLAERRFPVPSALYRNL